MHVPEWHVTLFDIKIDNKGNESDLEDELIEMHINTQNKSVVQK